MAAAVITVQGPLEQLKLEGVSIEESARSHDIRDIWQSRRKKIVYTLSVSVIHVTGEGEAAGPLKAAWEPRLGSMILVGLQTKHWGRVGKFFWAFHSAGCKQRALLLTLLHMTCRGSVSMIFGSCFAGCVGRSMKIKQKSVLKALIAGPVNLHQISKFRKNGFCDFKNIYTPICFFLWFLAGLLVGSPVVHF